MDQFGGATLAFPVSFDLRIIYVLSESQSIVDDFERIFASLEVPCELMQSGAKEGAKYGRMGARITLESREQMYALYEEIRKLPYVKAAI